MFPFGNLHGLDVYVAQSLAGKEEIAFGAGSHHELLRLCYLDFQAVSSWLPISACRGARRNLTGQ